VKRHRPLSPDAHAHLDGIGRAPESADERRILDQLNRALSHYRQNLQVPGPGVDDRVMAVVAAPQSTHRSLWRWFFAPVDVRVRPATAFVAGVALVLVLALVVPRVLPRGPGGTDLSSQSVLVQFELRAPAAQSVSLAGSFNGWSPASIPLTRTPESDRWRVTIPLRPGEHEYLFVIDREEWVADPHAHAQVDDGFGQSNSVIMVGPRGVARL
jgi:hypothetical protein